ncbi:hypothetical protein AL036_14235 [Salipiger aestuarii]|uniref:hypothetical protein n=1 Tax=Salipiger aestuarii TaxID=568098 RepID=UPI00123AE62F|nr:hypothetical protein [Salipiger aestuarii]KAA8606495.1 hypothetical protein AL036_14235 [Salipiger aestuarii]KAA8610907.1 hypothetical protein AL037_11365 [Salipiger aestuarii]
MVIIALLAGSALGFFAAIVGWLFAGLTPFDAAMLYLGTALGFGLLPFAVCAVRSMLRAMLRDDSQAADAPQ